MRANGFLAFEIRRIRVAFIRPHRGLLQLKQGVYGDAAGFGKPL